MKVGRRRLVALMALRGDGGRALPRVLRQQPLLLLELRRRDVPALVLVLLEGTVMAARHGPRCAVPESCAA